MKGRIGKQYGRSLAIRVWLPEQCIAKVKDGLSAFGA